VTDVITNKSIVSFFSLYPIPSFSELNQQNSLHHHNIPIYSANGLERQGGGSKVEVEAEAVK
jgi:hypothetical protein